MDRDVVCWLSSLWGRFPEFDRSFPCAGKDRKAVVRVKDAKAAPGLDSVGAGTCGAWPVTAFALPRCFDAPHLLRGLPQYREKSGCSQAAMSGAMAW